jgi:hypothetical protein
MFPLTCLLRSDSRTRDRRGSFEGDGSSDGNLAVWLLPLLACPSMGDVGVGFRAAKEPGEDRYAERLLT